MCDLGSLRVPVHAYALGVSDVDMGLLTDSVGLNARRFRTLLRVLTQGLHLNQAMILLALRAESGNEMLADDVNTVLCACAFGSEKAALHSLMNHLKAAGKLTRVTDEDAVNEARAMLAVHDTGATPNLYGEQKKRSPEMHEIAAARKAAATVGATEVAVAGRKRGRHAMGSTAANEGEKATEGASLAAADGCCAGAGCAHSGASPGPVAASTEEAVAEAAFASAQPGVRPTRLSKEEDDAERAAYRRVNELLLGTFTSTEPAFLAARLAKARTVFSNMSTLFKLEPNARTYVLMLKTALNAGDVEYARSLVHSMFASGVASPATLYQFLQPAFLAQLRDAGVISAADASITHPPGSQASCYLAAAAEAAKGNQYGSKHGAVLVKDGRVLALGHNHRYATRGNPHVRVMHAEVHALIQLPTEQHARGTECYIVELDAEGIGYEEAIPCPMCQTALCQLGVAKAHYSSHSGIITVPVSYRPHLHCETYTMALAREYPKGTHKPDTPVPEYLQARSADATGAGASVDAATTATEVAAAPVNVVAERVATATTVASASAALADAVAAALPQEAQLA